MFEVEVIVFSFVVSPDGIGRILAAELAGCCHALHGNLERAGY